MLLNYFRKVFQDNIVLCSDKSILVTEEENKLRKQFQLLDDPKSKWKKSSYGQHDEFQRAEIAKWRIANGIRVAARKFSVLESTVRGYIKYYNNVKGENIS